MTKVLVVAALLGLAACGSKEKPAAADSSAAAAAAPAPAPAPAQAAATPDTTKKVAGDTAKKP